MISETWLSDDVDVELERYEIIIMCFTHQKQVEIPQMNQFGTEAGEAASLQLTAFITNIKLEQIFISVIYKQ